MVLRCEPGTAAARHWGIHLQRQRPRGVGGGGGGGVCEKTKESSWRDANVNVNSVVGEIAGALARLRLSASSAPEENALEEKDPALLHETVRNLELWADVSTRLCKGLYFSDYFGAGCAVNDMNTLSGSASAFALRYK